MVEKPPSARGYSATLLKIAGLWWLVSVVASLVLLQPFEYFLLPQSESASHSAYDPFVLWVTLQREQQVLAGAVATATVLLIASKLCSQVPHTLALVALASRHSARITTVLRCVRALPHVALLALLSEGLPLLLLYVATAAGSAWASLLDAAPSTLVAVALGGVALLAGWLVCLTILDFARVAVVASHQRPSVSQCLIDATTAVLHAPLPLLVRSTLARAASWLCLAITLVGSIALASTPQPATSGLAWLVAQGGVVLSLWIRVAWLAYATRTYNLRPPSLNS